MEVIFAGISMTDLTTSKKNMLSQIFSDPLIGWPNQEIEVGLQLQRAYKLNKIQLGI